MAVSLAVGGTVVTVLVTTTSALVVAVAGSVAIWGTLCVAIWVGVAGSGLVASAAGAMATGG